ncbi:MAG: hypothetical protein IKD78_13710 [Bacteroidales bacterium]|jgi:hypothetical protein|nr:hypothetical protein [Bacteroidales bacterium]
MKKLYFILLTLLLLGCQSPKNQNKASTLDCFVPRNDEGTEDSIKEYYERMERWEMLHGRMSMWESDK